MFNLAVADAIILNQDNWVRTCQLILMSIFLLLRKKDSRFVLKHVAMELRHEPNLRKLNLGTLTWSTCCVKSKAVFQANKLKFFLFSLQLILSEKNNSCFKGTKSSLWKMVARQLAYRQLIYGRLINSWLLHSQCIYTQLFYNQLIY